jgi:hypothetical protein
MGVAHGIRRGATVSMGSIYSSGQGGKKCQVDRIVIGILKVYEYSIFPYFHTGHPTKLPILSMPSISTASELESRKLHQRSGAHSYGLYN